MLVFLGIEFNVTAYSIDIWPEEIKIDSIHGSHVVCNEENLSSNVFMFFSVPEDFFRKYRNLTIHFDPWEHLDNEPITNPVIQICDNPTDWGYHYDTGFSGNCNQSYKFSISNATTEKYFIYNGQAFLKNYSEYEITFTPNKKGFQRYVFIINYTTPHFIFKQGDYFVAWLNFPNMPNGDYTIENSLVLSNKEDIPRFIPEAKKIERIGYYEGKSLFYRWAFIFNGTEDRIIWYLNDKIIKDNEKKLQKDYTVLGALLGAIIGLVTAIIIIFLERIFFDWFPYGNKINRWIVNHFNPDHVIGNTNGKVYHSMYCKYFYSLAEKNKKHFRNRFDAEKNGYTPCPHCIDI